MSKIVALIGSERKNGNTCALVNAFVEGAARNNTVELVYAGDVDVSPCRGCNSCYRTEDNLCVVRDDMDGIVEILSNADIIVIATPIYFFSVSSQLKRIIDRLHFPGRKNFKVRGLVLLAAATGTSPDNFAPIKAMYEATISYFGLKDYGSILVGGVRDIGDICGREELVEARTLGESIRL